MDSIRFYRNCFLLLAVLLDSLSVCQGQATTGCKISLSKLTNARNGIVLEKDSSGNWKLKEPLEGYYRWSEQETIYIGCGEELRTSTCENLTAKIVCKVAPNITYKKVSQPSASCSEKKSEYQMGFEINNEAANSAKITIVFVPYYNICYDEKDCSVIYTHHQLLGHAFSPRRVPRAGKELEQFDCKKPNFGAAYTKKEQRKKGIMTLDDDYLQKGHLFPDRDAPVHAWKLATYSYGNCAPQWNKINSGGGNWNKLEGMVLNTSIENGETYDIFDGVLYDEKNTAFLDKEFVKIPLWFWKIVIHKADDQTNQKGMIFFVYNDPSKTPKQLFCNSQCAINKWLFDSPKEKGSTHCCVPNNLNAHILGKIPTATNFQHIETALKYGPNDEEEISNLAGTKRSRNPV